MIKSLEIPVGQTVTAVFTLLVVIQILKVEHLSPFMAS